MRATYPNRSSRSPPSGGRDRDGRLLTALTIWVSSAMDTDPSERGGISIGQRDLLALDSAIQPTVGSIPRIVTVPLPYGVWAATTRPPDVARARPRIRSPAIAGTSVAPFGMVPSSDARDSGAASIVDAGR